PAPGHRARPARAGRRVGTRERRREARAARLPAQRAGDQALRAVRLRARRPAPRPLPARRGTRPRRPDGGPGRPSHAASTEAVASLVPHFRLGSLLALLALVV